ncbi:MAG TPA: hypothetical protein VFB21_03100 [Chthonomonadaceae bacterium]|nr:hypothetical protein [Chthonomonadaceae bacterium]
MLKYSDNTRSRIHDGLKKYSRIVAQARQRGMNERDTGDIVRAILGDMLGYDPFFDVTAEVSLRGGQADYAVLTDERLRFLVAIKSINVVPNAAHLLGLSGTAAPAYADWIVLTNADVWACYRLGVGADRHAAPVFRTSLLDTAPLDEKTTLFFLLSKEGAQQEALSQYWEQTQVLHPSRLASLLLSEEVLTLLRREIQRTASYRVDRQVLYDLLTREVLRPDALVPHGQGGEPAAPRLPQCYAYVRDPNAPATWKLGYRNPDGTPNAEMLSLAVADLRNGAQTLGIPADDLPLVKERLRQAFLELPIPYDDLPDILKL